MLSLFCTQTFTPAPAGSFSNPAITTPALAKSSAHSVLKLTVYALSAYEMPKFILIGPAKAPDVAPNVALTNLQLAVASKLESSSDPPPPPPPPAPIPTQPTAPTPASFTYNAVLIPPSRRRYREPI